MHSQVCACRAVYTLGFALLSRLASGSHAHNISYHVSECRLTNIIVDLWYLCVYSRTNAFSHALQMHV